MSYCSIIMTCYRTGHNARNAIFQKSIAPLLQNTSYPFELILMDNTQNNRGLGAARNAGFALATGEYICYVDDDIRFWPGWLETCITILTVGEKIIATPLRYANTYWYKKYYQGQVSGYDCHLRAGSNCMVMTRKAAIDIGPFINRHVRKDGVEFQTRLCRKGYRVLMPADALAHDMSIGMHSYE